MKIKNILYSVFLIIIVNISVSNVFAQSRWLDHGQGNSISIEIYKPIVPVDSNTAVPGRLIPGITAPSGAVFLTGRYDLYKQLTLVGEIPFSGGALDDTSYHSPGYLTKIGNPYLGVEYKIPQSPIMFELGLRLPLTPDSGKVIPTIVGARADIDRVDAFIKKIVPVYFAANYTNLSESNIYFNAKLGTSIWFNSKTIGLYQQPYVSAVYALQIGYIQKYVHIITGLSGVYAVDTGPDYPNKDNFMQLGLLVTGVYKNIRPGLSIRVPGQDAAKLFNYVLGLNFTYGFE